MSRPVRFATLAIPLLAATLAPAFPDRAEPLGERLDTWIEPLVAARDLAGSVVVSHRGEETIVRSYGWADRAGATPFVGSTRAGIGSIAKQFTAAALLVLRDEARVDLHAPITGLLPEMAPHDDITLHHLLTHQAGLVRDLPDDAPVGASFLETLAALPRASGAGEVTSYSNCGFGVVAAAVERAAGEPLEVVVARELLEPLGLRDTGFWDGRPVGDGHADALDPGVGRGAVALAPPRDLTRTPGAGGMLSTAADLVKWLTALRDGAVLSDSARALAFADHGGGRGYGFGVYTRGGRHVIGHDGVTNGFTAFAEWYPDEDLLVAYTGNVRTHAFEWLEDALPRLVFGEALPELPRVGTAIEGVDPGVAGSYRVSDVLIVEVRLVDGRLELRGTGGYFTPLLRLAPDRYWYRSRFSMLEFERASDGRVTAVEWCDAHGARFTIPRLAETQRER